MRSTDADRIADGLFDAKRQGVTSDELGEEISRMVALAVAHDALELMGTCPATGFGPESLSFWHGVESDFGRALVNDYHGGVHPCPPEQLVCQPIPAGVIGPGHQGGPRHRRAQRLFAAHGVGCELRMLLRDARGMWGTLVLLRAEGGRPFGPDDVERVRRLVPALIRVLRGYVTAGPLAPAVSASPPGVVILGPDHTIRSATPQAHAMLDRLRGRHTAPDWVFHAFLSGLSRRVRRQPHGAPLPPAFGPAASYGRWIMCEAQPLDGDAVGDVAVIIQPAPGPRLLPQFCDWYGLTARESHILARLSDGAAPKQIARRLEVSVHTVNDHLKAIYSKTRAEGRDHLLAAFTT